MPTLSTFKPGQPWHDTSGKPIQAHAGSIITVDGVHYWYGENKEFTTGDMKVWTWGIRCYRSKDLYNWEDLGLIIEPDTGDETSPLHPRKFLDRPHIIYNRFTQKFICWIKVMGEELQTRTVLVADKITGPYKMLHRYMRPVGMSAGDFDLVVCPDDGKAYMYFERVHFELICADLTDDYTACTGYYSTHFPHPGPPTVREAPAYFRRKGKHYLTTSGTTGYFPNPSEVAMADMYHGPFTVLGDLHPTDRTRTSFNSQISCIFKHPGKKDLYIAMADRWMGPLVGEDFESGQLSRHVGDVYDKYFSVPRRPFTEAEEHAAKIALTLEVNTSQSRYVWLPIRFDGDRPYIEWRDEWSIDEFE